MTRAFLSTHALGQMPLIIELIGPVGNTFAADLSGVVMRALLIATGNRLRRDEGVAHPVLEQLGSVRDVESGALLQLMPEVAEDTAGYDTIIFIDADIRMAALSIEALNQVPASPSLTHVSRPAEIVELSGALFGFAGRAFLCRISADDFVFRRGIEPASERACDASCGKVGESAWRPAC